MTRSVSFPSQRGCSPRLIFNASQGSDSLAATCLAVHCLASFLPNLPSQVVTHGSLYLRAHERLFCPIVR